ncbi:hypothetical protein BpHYR1_025272 [Brachionus plicatilis]|uniref:Uncharacterized protein n=1 Tax=Brachionus plicatilis TaxID=10195 RepID=A0A3M7Q8G9_BRAPC|nr:hypothetical protein BpHYR1_025272 [Brachionus plicatilis]
MEEIFSGLEFECSLLKSVIEDSNLSSTQIVDNFAQNLFQEIQNANNSLGEYMSVQDSCRVIGETFKRMKNSLERTEAQVVADIPKLSIRHQREVVKFWSHASKFFEKIIGMISEAFSWLVKNVRNGLRWVKNKITTIYDYLVSLFNYLHD